MNPNPITVALDKLACAAQKLRYSLVYDDTLSSIRASVLDSFTKTKETIDVLEAEETRIRDERYAEAAKAQDFALLIPAGETYTVDGYVRNPDLEVYFIAGSFTRSKIQAIKLHRNATNEGLKESKDYVEALPRRVLTPGDLLR